MPARLGGDTQSNDVGMVQNAPSIARAAAKVAGGKASNTMNVAGSVPVQQAFATSLRAAVVNSPSQEPDGVVLKNIPIGTTADQELIQERVQREILAAQQAVVRTFLS